MAKAGYRTFFFGFEAGIFAEPAFDYVGFAKEVWNTENGSFPTDPGYCAKCCGQLLVVAGRRRDLHPSCLDVEP